ncbi:MAG: hypothetical protein H6713_03695 [Myxococcales bacterium]|nr:hypothetical protein [Myxococcales bacterium]
MHGFDHEIEMIKPALLYADSVTLNSGGASLISSMIELENLADDDKVRLAANVSPYIFSQSEASALMQVIRARKNRRREPKLINAYENMKRRITKEWPKITTKIASLADLSKYRQLRGAIERGVLHVEVFGRKKSPAKHAASTLQNLIASSVEGKVSRNSIKPIYDAFVDAVIDSVKSPNTYPMLDPDIRGLVRSRLSAGDDAIPIGGVSRSKQAGVAFHLLSRLPGLQNVTLDEVISIREELNAPLQRFRAALIEFSDNVKHAAWHEGFEFDADRIFRKDVVPAVEEIKELLLNNKFSKHALNETLTPVGLAGPISAILSPLKQLPDMLQFSLLATSAAAGASVLLRARQKMLEERVNIERNQMYFYYAAGEKMIRC